MKCNKEIVASTVPVLQISTDDLYSWSLQSLYFWYLPGRFHLHLPILTVDFYRLNRVHSINLIRRWRHAPHLRNPFGSTKIWLPTTKAIRDELRFRDELRCRNELKVPKSVACHFQLMVHCCRSQPQVLAPLKVDCSNWNLGWSTLIRKTLWKRDGMIREGYIIKVIIRKGIISSLRTSW